MAGRTALRIYLFASSTCSECRELRAGLLPRLQQRHAGAVHFTHIPVDDVESFKLQLLYETRYGVRDDEALKLFIGAQCLSGRKAIVERLDAVIAEELAKGSATPTPEEVRQAADRKPGPSPAAAPAPRSRNEGGATGATAERRGATTATAGGGCATTAEAEGGAATASAAAIERFGRFRPGAIALAGLIDGINPCAFTTLIFFISLLAALGKGRRELIVVGLCFAAAVFLTYLALGLGALKAVKVASVNLGISKAITWTVIGLTLLFAACSIYDFYKYRRSGKGEDLTLKLPDRIRNRIRTLISRQMRTRNLVIGALILGVAVSLLEALCTGQVYLPTLTCIVQDRDLAPKAVGYLLLYNGLFILPLLGVFGLAICGVTSERLAAFSRRHVATTKLLLGLVFLGLAVLLIATTL